MSTGQREFSGGADRAMVLLAVHVEVCSRSQKKCLGSLRLVFGRFRAGIVGIFSRFGIGSVLGSVQGHGGHSNVRAALLVRGRDVPAARSKAGAWWYLRGPGSHQRRLQTC